MSKLSAWKDRFDLKLNTQVDVRISVSFDPKSQAGMPFLIITMGVSGCGKSVVGEHLSRQLGIEFMDGDELHPAENIAKMSTGQPLTDDDRKPWLHKICQYANDRLTDGRSVIIACSALKTIYRDQIRAEVSSPVVFVHLTGSWQLIHERMSARQDHYMKAEMLRSQMDDLQDPIGEKHVITIEIAQDLDSMLKDAETSVVAMIDELGSSRHTP